VDPQRTVILHNTDHTAGFYCNMPVTLSIITRDQYGVTVSVPALRVRNFTEHLLLIIIIINVKKNFRFISDVRLSVVCNICVPYSGDSNFPQCFYAVWYLGYP